MACIRGLHLPTASGFPGNRSLLRHQSPSLGFHVPGLPRSITARAASATKNAGSQLAPPESRATDVRRPPEECPAVSNGPSFPDLREDVAGNRRGQLSQGALRALRDALWRWWLEACCCASRKSLSCRLEDVGRFSGSEFRLNLQWPAKRLPSSVCWFCWPLDRFFERTQRSNHSGLIPSPWF